MDYFLFFLIASLAVGVLLYFVIEDLKLKKFINKKKKEYEDKKLK